MRPAGPHTRQCCFASNQHRLLNANTRGLSLTAAPATTSSEKEPSKIVFNSNLIANLLQGFPRVRCCVFVSCWPRFTLKARWHVFSYLIILLISLSSLHLLVCHFFYLAPVSPINKYSWTSGIFVFVWCSQSDIAQGIIECASHL